MEGSNNTTLVALPSNKNGFEIVELIYLCHVALLTLFGNCLVILAFVVGPRSIRTFTNYFVVNLAVSDILVGCVSLPFWIVFRTGEKVMNLSYLSIRHKGKMLEGIEILISQKSKGT